MTYTFFNQMFDNGVNEVLSWFGINLSFQVLTLKHVLQIGKKSLIQRTLKFTISTWRLLLSCWAKHN